MNRLAKTVVLCCALFGPPATAAAGDDPFRDPEVRHALKELDKEPTIQEAQKAALEFFRIDPDTVGSMRTRAGLKSLLPSLGSKYRYGASYVDLSKWDFIQYPDRVAGRDAADFTVNEVEVSASWDLSRLIFNPEVLDVSSLVVLQEGVLKEITRIYFTRRRLQVDMVLNPPTDPETKLSKELRIQELTSTLDAMTGNLFANYYAEGEKKPEEK